MADKQKPEAKGNARKRSTSKKAASRNRHVTQSGNTGGMAEEGAIPTRDETVGSDMSDLKRAEERLHEIERMLQSKPSSSSDGDCAYPESNQGYGDLTALNRGGLIVRSIDKKTLREISSEYVSLLETSFVVYEKNGDYAFGIFSSSWCRMMDQAFRNLCHTEDTATALASGKWLCHESRWACCSRQAIDTRTSADIECNGGIRLHAVPIFAGEEVIGAIGFGYGDPPRDPARLQALADLCGLDRQELVRNACAYRTRPAVVIEIAKQRLHISARLIGTLVERKRAQEALAASQQQMSEVLAFNKSILKASSIGILIYDATGKCIYANKDAAEIFGTSAAGLLSQNFHRIESWKKNGMYEAALRALNTYKEQESELHTVTTFGKDVWLNPRYSSFYSKGEKHLLLLICDVTKRMLAEQALLENEQRLTLTGTGLIPLEKPAD